jgi:hypothetical protein
MKNHFEITNHERNTAMKRFLLLCIPLLVVFLTACPTTTPSGSKPTITSFSASPASLPAGGGSTTLIWDVKDATTLSIDNGVGAVTGTSKTVSVTSDKTFTLTAMNDSGSTTQTASVSVAAGADTTPPTVVSIEPQDGATGVKKDANIIITFSEKMDQAATQTAYQSATLAAVTFTWNAEGTTLTVKPNAPLAYSTGTDPNAIVAQNYSFSLTTTAKDAAGNALATVSSSFSTLRRINITLPNQLELGGTFYRDDTYIIGTQQETQVGYRNGFYGRGYFSVDLSSIPSAVKGESLEIATLTIHKNGIVGNPYAGPAFNSGVFLDHMNYGSGLNQIGLYSLTSLAEIVVFDDALDGANGDEFANVTAAVRDDLNNRDSRGSRSQYRLRFPVGTTVSDTTKDAYVGFSSTGTIALSYLIP